MDFCEKLQKLRKDRGLTQEELAEALYVSRTAVSKWESGRGYPSIDSLKEISAYFSVSIDDLLSGEKLISIAEKENKTKISGICSMLHGAIDIFSLMLILLPLYPKTIDGYIYSVNLFDYTETSKLNILAYWIISAALIITGVIKILMLKTDSDKIQKSITFLSMILSIIAVIYLSLAGETYAVTFVFFLLIVKTALIIKSIR